MGKHLILITGSVMNSNPESVEVYNKLISMIEVGDYEITSPLDTIQFVGTPAERYARSIDILSNTLVMIAEMSSVSTGQGMEIQQAANLGIPILVIAKENSKVSGLVQGCPVVKNIVYYSDIELIKEDVNSFIRENTKSNAR